MVNNVCRNPLVWVFCSRQSNNLINKVYERGLRLTYRDETKDFQQILREKNEITIHQRNLQVLMTQVYKIVNSIAPPIMNLHTKYKNAKSLDEFKSKIKAWKCDFCQCRLCKKYVQNLGFI